MRKIVAGFAISLDGYIEGPQGEYDWIIMDQEFDFTGHLKKFDTFLFGRKSYEKFKRAGNPSFPGITNYVISNSLDSVDKTFILAKGDPKKTIEKIREQKGKDIAVYGGANLLSSLLDLDLIDEIQMTIIPVMLGSGKPMVATLRKRAHLTLIEVKKFGSGAVQLIYQVKHK